MSLYCIVFFTIFFFTVTIKAWVDVFFSPCLGTLFGQKQLFNFLSYQRHYLQPLLVIWFFLFDFSLPLYHLLLASHCPCAFLALVLFSFIYTHIANCSLIISTHCHVNPFRKLFIIFISKMPLQGQNSFPEIFILSGLCITYIYLELLFQP